MGRMTGDERESIPEFPDLMLEWAVEADATKVVAEFLLMLREEILSTKGMDEMVELTMVSAVESLGMVTWMPRQLQIASIIAFICF